MYGEGETLLLAVEEASSKKRKLSLSMISIGEKKSQTETRSGGSEQDEVWGAKKLKLKVDEEKAAMVSKEVEIENSTEVAAENAKEVRTESIKEMEAGLKEVDIFF